MLLPKNKSNAGMFFPSRDQASHPVASVPADFALLRAHLVPADLPVFTRMETGNTRIDAVQGEWLRVGGRRLGGQWLGVTVAYLPAD